MEQWQRDIVNSLMGCLEPGAMNNPNTLENARKASDRLSEYINSENEKAINSLIGNNNDEVD
jgi:hypothetical protein